MWSVCLQLYQMRSPSQVFFKDFAPVFSYFYKIRWHFLYEIEFNGCVSAKQSIYLKSCSTFQYTAFLSFFNIILMMIEQVDTSDFITFWSFALCKNPFSAQKVKINKKVVCGTLWTPMHFWCIADTLQNLTAMPSNIQLMSTKLFT